MQFSHLAFQRALERFAELDPRNCGGRSGRGPEVDLREILKVKSIARKVLAATAKPQPTEIR